MRSNLRGDSGLSDSGFYKSQKSFLKKHKEELDKLEMYGRMETQRRRYEAGAKAPKRSMWSRIKGFFGLK